MSFEIPCDSAGVPIPLHSIEAEMSALGSCVYGARAVDDVLRESAARDYYRPSHQKLFRTIKAMRDARQDIDLVTLKERLIRQNDLEGLGGEEYLIRLAETVPSPGSAAHYARIVRENAVLRHLAAVGQKIFKLAYDEDMTTPEKVAKVMSMAKADHFGFGLGLDDLSEIDPNQHPEEGIRTGFRRFDAATGCGLPKGQTTLVSARQKGGKTAFLLGLALAGVREGKTVVYATLADLNPFQIKRRLLKMLSGHDRQPQQAEAFDEDSYEAGLGFLNDHFKDGSLFVYDGRKYGTYVEELAARMTGRVLETKVDLLIVDYAQKLKSRERGGRDNKTAEQEICSDALKRLAEDLNVPIAVGSQITEGGAAGQTTKYARAWEEDAGLVLNIGGIEDPTSDSHVTMTIPYNRFGPRGRFDLLWRARNVGFEEV